MTRKQEILHRAERILLLPACTQKALQLLDSPEADSEDLARLIEFDPGLTANLLKIVNASRFDAPVCSVRDAVGAFGSGMIIQFFVSTGVVPFYVQKIEGYDLAPHMLMQSSVTAALCAEELGRALGMGVPGHTYTSALLAGVGKLILGAYVKVEARPILDLAAREGIGFDEAEDRILGINHAEVGAWLLERWRVPGPIVRVVRHHLRPELCPEVDPVLDLVHAGTVMSKMIGLGLGADGLNYIPSRAVIDRLGLTPEVADRVSAEVVERLGPLNDLFLECADTNCLL